MYRKQFLLTSKTGYRFDWKRIKIGEMSLYSHLELDVCSYKTEEQELYLLGSIYDWEYPEQTNSQIVKRMANVVSISELLKQTARYCGEYVIIFKQQEKIYLFHDASGQAEIYYDKEFCSFGTQPKLIAEVEELIPHTDPLALDFYSSDIFKKKCLFVGETTHVKNIKHLLPNKFIDIEKHQVERFFPRDKIKRRDIDEVAEKAALMLKGYIKAVALRNPIALGVTAGHDSRVLFLASLDNECRYFVYQNPNMNDNHYDITIPRKLTSYYNRDFEVVTEKNRSNSYLDENYKNSIDFPRFINFSAELINDYVYINGNISEVVRNLYGYYKNATAADFTYLAGSANDKFVEGLYGEWLKTNKHNFKKLGYNYLDMFYWEQRMGTWAAKTKTEARAMGKEIFSPFNSRALLTLLSSVNRKMRDNHNTILYNKITSILAEGNSDVMELPYNPCFKQRMITLMNKLRIFNFYRYIGLKTRTLT